METLTCGSAAPSSSSSDKPSQTIPQPSGSALDSSASSSSRSAHASSADSVPVGNLSATPPTSSTTSSHTKFAKVALPILDHEDSGSVVSNDPPLAAKVHIKSAISSPRSSVSSSGAIRRGAWRAVGAAPSASTSRSFTHGHRAESYASSSSSQHGADDALPSTANHSAQSSFILAASSPPHPDSPDADHNGDEQIYTDNPQQLSVSDHPAWHRVRDQAGVAAPGALSYLPSVPLNSLSGSTIKSPASTPGPSNTDQHGQVPDFSHPFRSASQGDSNFSREPRPRAGTIGPEQGHHVDAEGSDGLSSSVESGAYDWANFVYAYARGRWNPGLIPQPAGQSTAFPGAITRITTTRVPSDGLQATAADVLNRRRPSLEYVLDDTLTHAAMAASSAAALSFEPHSLPLSARGSAGATTDGGDGNTIASLPPNAFGPAPTIDGPFDDKTPLGSHTLEYISSPEGDAPISRAVESAAGNGGMLDPSMLEALRVPSVSMSSAMRKPADVANDSGTAPRVLPGLLDSNTDDALDAQPPQRAKTAPEGLPTSVLREQLPSQNEDAGLDPAAQLASNPSATRRQKSYSVLEETRETVASGKTILANESNKPVVSTPISTIFDPLQCSTPTKEKSFLSKETVSPMSRPRVEAAAAKTKSKLAHGTGKELGKASTENTASTHTEAHVESDPHSRPGPTPIQSSNGVPKQPVVWQSAPEGLSAFAAEAMSRQASGAVASDSKSPFGNEVALDNVTVAGLRRAARRTSMERSVVEMDRARLDGGRNSRGSLVSHSASFPGTSPRPSISGPGGPREGVQALSHLSMGANHSASSGSASASASTNNGPTVNVAHFVGGKQSGETRIDLRGTVTSSPGAAVKEAEDSHVSGMISQEVSAKDVSLAANASTTNPRPTITTTSSQRIQSYLAAGKRVELFYRDCGYLPAILPPHEKGRLHALSRYGPPKIAGNPNFERIAHLVKLVFNSKLVLITLVGENEQIFQAQMGGGGEITIASLQSMAGSRNCSFCSHAILQDSDEPIVVFDAAKDWRFSGNPLVQGSPDIRFYAGSPLRTSDGFNIGSLCLIDDKPRTEFGPRQRHTLKEFARVVMREMELLRDRIQFGMRDRMQRSVELFTKECLEMDSEDGDSAAVATAGGTIGTHKVFQLAAGSMREALQASGAVIFDLSHFELIDRYDDNFVSNDLGTGTSSKIYFANPLSTQDMGAAASRPSDDETSPEASPEADDSPGTTVNAPNTGYGKRKARERAFDGTSGVETFRSPFDSLASEQQDARAKRVPPMSVLGASEADGVPPERNEAVPLSHHVQVAEFLRVHRTGKFYSYAPPPFRSVLPHGVTGLLLVPIFGLNKQPFALLCAYITTRSERSIALEELQVSGLQYLRALGMIVLSAILKKDIMLADKAKSNFISNISHELRTPLHGILAAAELLAETKMNATQGSYLETVEACGKSLLELVNHVLDFTKLSGNARAGQRSIQTKTKCDMVKLIQEVCESSWIGQMVRQVESASSSGIGSVYAPPTVGGAGGSMVQARAKAARESKVETIIDIALREDGWLVNCDTGGIRRVLMNLVGNSLKFTSAGFVHVSLREVQSSKTHIMIELSVTDTGKGISRAFLEEQLFHPFTQENPHGTGTGLGLSIVNSIVQSPSLNGKIDVWSTEGEGTEIRVTFELELCDDEDMEGPTYKPAINVHQGYSVALLGFDDSRGDQDLRHALEGYFHNWWEFKVTDGTTKEQLREGDVIAINDDMQLLERVMTERKGDLPPVIFLTASRGESEIALACENYHAAGGVARILFKPAGPAKLESVVDFCLQCLERRRSGDPASSEETKPSTPLPSPSEGGAALQQMEKSDSYFAPRHSRPNIHQHPGHELGSFDTNASITPRADGGLIPQMTPSDQHHTSSTHEAAASHPTLAEGELRNLRRPTLVGGIERIHSNYMSPDPPGSSSNSLIRRHSTEARMDGAREDASSAGTLKPSRPLLPARSITYHEPRLHKHVLMSPMGGHNGEGESYFERVPTPNLSPTPNTPGSTVSLEGGDGAVLKSVLASSRSGNSVLGAGVSGSGESRKRMQILSVEDNAINRKVIAAFLAKLDVDFVEATNGEEGIAQFSRYPTNHFDVILMDLSMPVLDGISAISAIRKIEMERYQNSTSGSSHRTSSGNAASKRPPVRCRAKIFALTGRSTDEDKRQAFQTGADGYIVKPLSFKVLSSLLRMLMR